MLPIDEVVARLRAMHEGTPDRDAQDRALPAIADLVEAADLMRRDPSAGPLTRLDAALAALDDALRPA